VKHYFFDWQGIGHFPKVSLICDGMCYNRGAFFVIIAQLSAMISRQGKITAT
jgi:hypothetical protein